VLCLHGLTGTPYEVRPIAEALASRGVRARGPSLPGHDSTPEDLAKLDASDWVEAVRRELDALCAEHDQVFAVGVSLGGVLSLTMAAADQRIAALAVIGTPLRLAGPIPWLVPAVKFVLPFLAKSGGSDIQDPAARERHPGYSRMPLHSVHQLVRLQEALVKKLATVRAPILVAHGAKDATASPGDADRILDLVGSDRRERLILERSGHIVPVDYDGEALAEAVAAFLLEHAEPS